VATVDAIHEATLEVLTAEGIAKFNTTRVADRAGVSVGSLYQYYPNKRSLLLAVLDGHLFRLAAIIEQTCHAMRGQPLAEMARVVANVFIDAKLQRPDVSKALYSIAEEQGGAALVARATRETTKFITAMLATAPDARKPADVELAATMLLGAMVGAVRQLLETKAAPSQVTKVREHLMVMCFAYLSATLVRSAPAGSARAARR
jgi:AcrR family transcriptional regulator